MLPNVLGIASWPRGELLVDVAHGDSPVLSPAAAKQGGQRRAGGSWCMEPFLAVTNSPAVWILGDEVPRSSAWALQASLARGSEKLHVPLSFEGNLSGDTLLWVKPRDVLLLSVVPKGLAWLLTCPLLFRGACTCLLSLAFS